MIRFLFNDRFTTQTAGGITVYYISPGKGKVTAFKPVRLLYEPAQNSFSHNLRASACLLVIP